MYFSLFVSLTLLSIFLLFPYLKIDKRLSELNSVKKRTNHELNLEKTTKTTQNFYNRVTAKAQKKLSAKMNRAGLNDDNLVYKFNIFKYLTLILSMIFITSYLLLCNINKDAFFAIKTTVVLFFLITLYFSPELYLNNKATKRMQKIKKYWSDALDLMIVCVESGSTIEYSLIKVVNNMKFVCEEIAIELDYTLKELNILNDRREAFHNLAKRTRVESIETFVQCVVQAERYGTPIGQALRVLAHEHREQRMQLAERKAAALPPKLTVPMILFFLPVIFAVILTPAIIQVSAQGGIMGGN